MFKEILLLLYFQNHFKKHLLQLSNIIIIIKNSISIELLNFLMLLEKSINLLKLDK